MKFLCALFFTVIAMAAEPRHLFENGKTAQAVVVPAQPLRHTAQVFGVTPEAALDALGETHPVKLNAYLRNAADEPLLRAAVVKRFQPPPALTCVVSELPEPGSSIGLDAVAPAASEGLGVLSAGGVAYISGQAEKGADLRGAARKTMESLGATLRFLGVDWAQAVQLKAFVQPISEAAAVREELAKFFPVERVPPIVLVEWIGGGTPLEIEVIASVPDASGPIEFLTPPGMKTSPVFCRVTRFAGPRIYLSGLSGSGDASNQVSEVFTELKKTLDAIGTDWRHLAKATYYVAADDVSKALNELRPKYYDPLRPPAASKAMVPRTGGGSSTFTMDMIAVPVP